MKKKLLALFSVIFAFALALGVFGACAKEVTVTLSQTEAELTVGKSVTLVATVSDGESIVTWASDNEAVATVTERGRVTGVKAGTANVTATVGKSTATCVVTVKDAVTLTFKTGDTVVTETTVDRDGTLQLSATASDGSTVTGWTSSDNEIATVSDSGLVSGLFDGDVTITARTSTGSGSLKVTVVDTAADKYMLGTEQVADKWYYYVNRDAGRETNVNRAEFRNGAVTFDFSGNGNWYYTDIQLGLKNSQVSEGWHKVTAKIDSAFDGAITILDTVVNLKEGENNVSVCYEQKAGGNSYHIYFAAGTLINTGKVVISDISWEDFTPVTLQTPSFTLGQDNKIAITDAGNTEGVKEYQVGLFLAGDVAPVFVRKFGADGGVLDVSECEDNGEYIVRIKAIGNLGYNSSDWSDGDSVKITVNNSSIVYDLATSGETEAVATGKWTCWAGDGGSITSAKYENKVVTLKGQNSSWAFYGVQLFREYSQFVTGDNLHISMKITTNGTGAITISGRVVNLTAGENNVDVYMTRGSGGATISMQLGVNGADVATWLTAGEETELEFVISEVSIEKYTPVQLVAPSFTISGEGVITVTDTNTAANVGGYEAVFYQGNAKKASIKVVNGEAMDVSKIMSGDYTVKLVVLAADNTPYANSAESEGVEYTVVNNGKYTLETGFTAADAAAAPGTWGVWADQNWCGSTVTVTSANFDNGTITAVFTSTGTCAFGLQFNYVNPAYTADTTYSFDIVASADMDIQIAEQEEVIHLTAGESAHLTGIAAAKFYFHVNIKDNVAGTITVSNVVWE